MIKLLMQSFFRRNQAGAPLAAPRKAPSLAACIVMDLLGYASFAVPFFGEALDIIWAPVSAIIFMRMFGGAKGVFGGIFNFIEELLPGLDFIPTFTIAWLLQYARKPKTGNTIVIAHSR
jgi:hypothetical protein